MRRAAALRAYADHGRTVCGWIGSGAILALIAKLGILPAVQSRLALRTAPWSARFLTCLLFASLFAVLRLPVAAMELWFWPTDQSVTDGLKASLSDSVLAVPFQAAGLFIALSLARLWPRRWPWAFTGVSAVLILFLILIAPITVVPWGRHDAPAPSGAGQALLEFVRRGGLQAERLYVFASADSAAVDMEGLLGEGHAAVSQAALSRPTPQTYAAVGHLLGHVRHSDLWGLTALWSLMAAGLFAGLYFLEAPLAAAFGAPRTSPGPDGRSLPILALIAWACFPIFMIGFNVFDQVINYRADAYALSLTRDPDGLCRWLVAIDARTKADPSDLEALLFFDHPPLARRLDSVLSLERPSP